MDFKLNEECLTIICGERVDSSNAEEFSNEVDKIIAANQFDSLALDFEATKYISSAGLRVVLRLAKTYSEFKVINVSVEVYDVFEMTGFSSIIKIEKEMREVSIEGAELIGDGFCSKVYRLNKDTIIKVITNTTDLNDIQRELNLCKQAFILGVPTSISFDVVKVGERYGVVFEMLDCLSLRDCILKNPDKLDEYIIMYANLLKKLGTTEKGDFKIPSAKELEFEFVKRFEPYVSKEDFAKINELLASIPDRNTLVHGDCHIKNIMVEKDEPALIDMDTLSYGDPIFEMAAIGATYIAFEKTEKGNTMNFLKLSAETCAKIYYDTTRLYFSNLSDEQYKANLDKMMCLTFIHMLYWTIGAEGMNHSRFDVCYEELKKYLGTLSDLRLEY
ncbi:MAG: phosphotransferase [Bacilli bacterium]|nr:phosphotransferase [Bacilli bacterium]